MSDALFTSPRFRSLVSNAWAKRPWQRTSQLSKALDSSRLTFEQLEPRLLLAGTFVDTGFTFDYDAGYPSKSAWADFDNDGFVDLLSNGNIWHNDAGTGFTLMENIKPSIDRSGDAVLADFNNDGWVDVFFYNTLDLYQNVDGTTFIEVNHLLPTMSNNNSVGAAWGDLNGDGYLDLYIGGYENPLYVYHPDRILLNNQGQGFSLAWEQTSGFQAARGITMADYDEDNDMDIYVSNYRLLPNQLWENDGLASFTNAGPAKGVDGIGPTNYGHTIGSAWGDVDSDGDIDLFVGNFRHNVSYQDHSRFYENLGSASGWAFADHELSSIWQESYATPALADYDNDGDLDLFFTTVYAGDNPRLYENTGGWNFANVTAAVGLTGLGHTYQASWADIDNDGDLDLMTDGKLFRNDIVNSNNWLKVHLAGDGINVNSSAIGAQVRADLGGGTIVTRQVEAGTGEGNQNDLTMQFGLGTFSGTVPLEIRWGDGTTDNYLVSPNQTLSYSRQQPNTAPVVDAGPDLQVFTPADSIAIDATVTDDGIPTPASAPITVWTKISGPGEVTFDDLASIDTTAHFSALGTYVLRLTADDQELTSYDEVTVSYLAGNLDPDDYEPNNTSPTATDLGNYDINITTGLNIHDSLDIDWFTWTAIENGPLTVDLEFNHFVGDLDLELYDSGGLLQLSNSATNNEQVSTTVTNGETYRLRVFGVAGAASPSYELYLNGPGVDLDAYEPNDSSPAAYDLGTIDDASLADLSIHQPNNDDWFTWTAEANGTLTVDALFSHAGGDLTLELYDPGGLIDSSATATDNEQVTATLSAGQTYRVRVFGVASATQADYDLVIDGQTNPPTLPGNLQAFVVSSTQIELAWIPSTDNVAVAGYDVFRGGVVVATVTDPVYSDSGLTTDFSYSYAVEAFDGEGYRSGQTAPVIIATPPLIDGLLGYWRFEDGAGSTATDSSGNGRHGTLSGDATWDTGKLGGGMSLDGDQDWVDMGNLPEFNFNNQSFSFAFWTNNMGAEPGVKFGKGRGGPRGWGISQQQFAIGYGFGGFGGASEYLYYQNNTPNGVWTHLAMTLDFPTRTVTLYQDGAAVPGPTGSLVLPGSFDLNDINVPVPLMLGTAMSGQLPYYEGVLDEVYLFDRTLSATDIAALAAVSPPNQGPAVDAGPTQSYPVSNSAVLDGTVTDDGSPNPLTPTAIYWSKASGPGYVTFDDPTAVDTTAHFSQPGIYVLQLWASDGELSLADTVIIGDASSIPTIPPSLSAAAVLPTRVDLSWQIATDDVAVTGYDVFRNSVMIATVTDNVYSDTTASPQTGYSYQVEAFDGDGNRSGLSAPAVAVTPADSGLIDGLLGYWNLDDAGSTATDSSGNGYHGTLVGSATWDTGKLGGAVSLDGFPDWVNMGNLPEFNFNNKSFSFAFWTNNMGATPGMKIAKGRGGTQGWGISQTQLAIGDSDGSEFLYYPTNTPNGTWTHLAMTLDFPTRTMTLYQDGVANAPVVLPASLDLGDINENAPLMLGAAMSGQNPYSGTLDDVYLFDRALDGSEVSALAAINPPNTAPVVNAGADQQIAAPTDTVVLDATASDDNLPTPLIAPTTIWTKITGPGAVTFGDPTAVDTTAQLSTVGTYVLRLTVDDGVLSTYDELTVESGAAALPDFDGNGIVAGGDFLVWQRGHGSGTTFAEGDANGDMAVDGLDRSIWQNNFGSTVVAAAAESVTSGTVNEPSGVSANFEVSAAPSSAPTVFLDLQMFAQPTDSLAGPTLATSAYDSSSDTPIALDSHRASHTKPHPQQTLAGDIDRHLARPVHDNRLDRLQGLDSDALWSAAVDQIFRDDPEWLTWPLL
jgi:chitodextrinase